MDGDYIRITSADPDDPEPKTLLNLKTSWCVGKVGGTWPDYDWRALYRLANDEWLVLFETEFSGARYLRVTAREAADWCVAHSISVPQELEVELDADCIGVAPADESNYVPQAGEFVPTPDGMDVGIVQPLRDYPDEMLDWLARPRKNIIVVHEQGTGKPFQLDTEAGPKWVGKGFGSGWDSTGYFQVEHSETLYRRKGWILVDRPYHNEAEQHGAPTFRWLTDQQAADWFLLNAHPAPADIAHHVAGRSLDDAEPDPRDIEAARKREAAEAQLTPDEELELLFPSGSSNAGPTNEQAEPPGAAQQALECTDHRIPILDANGYCDGVFEGGPETEMVIGQLDMRDNTAQVLLVNGIGKYVIAVGNVYKDYFESCRRVAAREAATWCYRQGQGHRIPRAVADDLRLQSGEFAEEESAELLWAAGCIAERPPTAPVEAPAVAVAAEPAPSVEAALAEAAARNEALPPEDRKKLDNLFGRAGNARKVSKAEADKLAHKYLFLDKLPWPGVRPLADAINYHASRVLELSSVQEHKEKHPEQWPPPRSPKAVGISEANEASICVGEPHGVLNAMIAKEDAEQELQRLAAEREKLEAERARLANIAEVAKEQAAEHRADFAPRKFMGNDVGRRRKA